MVEWSSRKVLGSENSCMTSGLAEDSSPFLPIIDPAFNEAEMSLTLERIAAFVKACGFATEMIARLKGYRIAEVPVNWFYGERGKSALPVIHGAC